MSGMVAIVSKEGAVRASDEELGKLTATYTALRANGRSTPPMQRRHASSPSAPMTAAQPR